MKNLETRILIFAKAPISGRVKTRLLPSMDAEMVTDLYKKLIINTLKMVIRAAIGPGELWCTPTINHPFFLQCSEIFRVSLRSQIEGDLGRRMAHAFEETLKQVPYAILIGTDCPSLTETDLKEAKETLIQRTPAVLIPAEDGGYALIGLRKYDPSLFEGITWGSSSVLEETRKRLRELGWHWRELEERWDVDRPEDVERLKEVWSL
jgi:rSAM/selenodomain-associated transferase 1